MTDFKSTSCKALWLLGLWPCSITPVHLAQNEIRKFISNPHFNLNEKCAEAK